MIGGKHNNFAQIRLREIGRNDYADYVAEVATVTWSSFNQNKHQQAKRNGFDLPKLRHQLKEIAKLDREQQPEKLAELIDREGLELRDAITEGRGRSRISLELPGDLRDHNCNRTLEICTADVAAFIEETRENLHDLRSNAEPYVAIEREATLESTLGDHRGTRTDSPEQPRNDPSPKRTIEGAGCYSQELTSEAVELAFAAEYLKPETRQFAANMCSDLTAADLDAPPDINDPYILKKLAAMLKRQMAKAKAVVSLAFRHIAPDR